MHRILLRTVVLDFEPAVHDRARDFWGTALGAEMRRGEHYPEYHVLEHPAATGPVMVQRLGTGPSRIHLDIETDDPEAEVARLVGAGATLVEQRHDWVVLTDPAGMLFCVVPAQSDDFEVSARTVG